MFVGNKPLKPAVGLLPFSELLIVHLCTHRAAGPIDNHPVGPPKLRIDLSHILLDFQSGFIVNHAGSLHLTGVF